MRKFIEENLLVSFILTLVAVAVVLGVGVAEYNQGDAEAHIEKLITAQESILKNLASITGRNGADTIIESIVSDCSRRTEYEALLMSLETLSKKDLIASQNLFEVCGNFYAERKALMVAKLERELEVYTDYVALLSQFREDPERMQKLEKWKELVSMEGTRSSLLNDQVLIQSQIITYLISGSSVLSKEVVALVQDAGEINDLLGVQDYRISELRLSLSK
jgi:hypothetical protein